MKRRLSLFFTGAFARDKIKKRQTTNRKAEMVVRHDGVLVSALLKLRSYPIFNGCETVPEPPWQTQLLVVRLRSLFCTPGNV